MSLNSDQINRLQRGLDLVRQAQTEISNANLSAMAGSSSSNVTSSLSTAINSIQSVLEQNSQQSATAGRGAGS